MFVSVIAVETVYTLAASNISVQLNYRKLLTGSVASEPERLEI